MEWTSGAINIWYFPRDHGLPSDVLGPNPNPSAWGTATASFAGGSGCDIDQHFMNNNIVFDTTFCGDWAGAVWGQDSTCSALAGSCQDYVQNHPEAFAEAYWTVNSLKVYQDNGNAPVAAAEAVKLQSSPSAVAGGVFAQETSSIPAPPVTTSPPAVQYTAPSPVQPPQRTRTHGELFESSETGTGYIQIVPRHVTDDETAKDTVNDTETGPVSPPQQVKAQKVSRHLHRHVHHLHHS
ncbi:MAG: hypothetical protein Q9181_008219 [Wetmoreana brouardii]